MYIYDNISLKYFFSENHAIYETTWTYMVEPVRPQATI
jgi:hypothetical protein